MKIWLFSDLHLEHTPIASLQPPQADVCIAAGDILDKGIVPSLEWLNANIAPSMPVIFVAGNHEFYRSSVIESLAAAKTAAADMPNVHFLHNRAVEIGDVLFVGATLWTDQDLHSNRQLSAFFAKDSQIGMKDYKKISWQKSPWQRLTPARTIGMHRESRSFIAKTLEARNGKAVVASHHAPSIQSMSETDGANTSAPSYASNLEALIEELKPSAWVHGHVHRSNRYRIGQTEILSNPRGYGDNEKGTSFDPSFVFEV
ncbi:metallophosphoesterase [Rhizobium sp. MHM7A]|uniref:metallophosphoesterase n=1 Tax=Rhizobium sp. MHM7A TaxID=2583233 RepID=UPI001106100E|nr:metallophosphoesterase [Rhizobium sp. MHM7A]TLX15759.1 phosphatase [Rhizobium sp. MHM7A]